MGRSKSEQTVLVAVAVLGALLSPAEACTAIGVGRLASTDGSVMVAHTDDSGGMGDPRLARVPARDWPAGAMRPVYLSIADYPRMIAPERSDSYAPRNDVQKSLPWAAPIGFIPQVNHTYAYWDVDYGLGNEHGLILAETTCAGRWGAAPVGQPNGTALFGIEELSKLALERCRTAACAVQTMGDLAEEHGYYGGNSHLGRFEPWAGTQTDEEGEALVLGDATGELWVFHILPGPEGGAVWAAQRMPEDSVTVVANMFVIRQMDLSDPSTYRASKGIEELAARLKLCKGAFDFTEAFSGDFKAASRTDALVDMFYTGRRVWRVFDLLAPSLALDPELGSLQEVQTYPIWVRPESKVSPAKVMSILRDHFEGTPYDLTQGPAAGPYGSPNRWDGAGGEHQVRAGAWERGISIHRTIFSFVAQARPQSAGLPEQFRGLLSGLVWFGQDSPHATCFSPLYLAQPSFARSWMEGTMAVYDEASAWWAAQSVKRVMDLNYVAMQPVVAAAQEGCEAEGAALVAAADANATKLLAAAQAASFPNGAEQAKAAALAAVGLATTKHAEGFVARWRGLLGSLFVAFKNGYNNTVILEGEVTRERNLGYPAWWLQSVGYGAWSAESDASQAKALARFLGKEEAAKYLPKYAADKLEQDEGEGQRQGGQPQPQLRAQRLGGGALPPTGALALCAALSFFVGAATVLAAQGLQARLHSRRLRTSGSGGWPGSESQQTSLLEADEHATATAERLVRI